MEVARNNESQPLLPKGKGMKKAPPGVGVRVALDGDCKS
jgi:hypothetical protein